MVIKIGFLERFKNGWDAFRKRDTNANLGPSYNYYPVRPSIPSVNNYRSTIDAIYNRIAVDVSGVSIHHVRLNEDGQYLETIPSELDQCLSLDTNIDQSAVAFTRDLVISMLQEGIVAVVPTGYSFRVAHITQWFPKHVQVSLYNQETGALQDIIIEKEMCAIIENPFYSVMNVDNRTAFRLGRKVALMDQMDEDIASGKIDLIIQPPYVIDSPSQQRSAKKKLKMIEEQLRNSKYGIAYIDGVDRITQLNRPVENHFVDEVDKLVLQSFMEMGVSQEIMNGTASEEQENNYYTKTVEPILSAICMEYTRKFLTRTARSQRQSIMYFRNPFKLMPANELATAADRLTRNEILSSNEIRSILGYKPSDDPRADQLINKNLRQPEDSNNNEVKENDDEQKTA